jgi:hypothetical protein
MTMPELEPEPVVKPNLKVHRPEPDPKAVVRAELEIEFTEHLLANLAAHGMTLEASLDSHGGGTA